MSHRYPAPKVTSKGLVLTWALTATQRTAIEHLTCANPSMPAVDVLELWVTGDETRESDGSSWPHETLSFLTTRTAGFFAGMMLNDVCFAWVDIAYDNDTTREALLAQFDVRLDAWTKACRKQRPVARDHLVTAIDAAFRLDADACNKAIHAVGALLKLKPIAEDSLLRIEAERFRVARARA